MIIALCPNEEKKQSFVLAKDIQNFISSHGIEVVTDDRLADTIGAKKISEVDRKKIKFLISMGGDGTILRLFHKYYDLDAAILGINLGSLGFMADIPVEDLYTSLEDLITGKYSIQKRTVLQGSISNKKPFYATNDIVIHRGSNHSLIELCIHVDGKYFNTFSADGIIIATPTGSTAYSLAAGGPILSPDLDAVVLTPICPHTISNRPIVLSASHKIEIQYLSKNKSCAEVCYDGIEYKKFHSNEKCTVHKSPHSFKLVKLERHDYFSTLRTKLGWSGKLTKN